MTFTHKLPKAAAFAFAAPVLATAAMAQDDCSTATNVAFDTLTPYDTTLATESGVAAMSCTGTGANFDLWFEFTAPADYTSTISACTATYDARLAVYTGACGSLTEVGCNDDSCTNGLFPTLDLALTAGTQYYVRVAGWNGAVGTGDLLVTGPPLPPYECVDADPITPDVPLSFDTTGASLSMPDFSCAAGGGTATSPDVWYEFTASADYTATVTTCGTATYDTKIEVYSGTCGALVSEACNDDGAGCAGFSSELTFAAVSGTQYFVRIGGYTDSDFGTGDVLVTGPPPAIANDECSGAIAIASGVAEGFDSTLATNSASAPAWSCGGTSANALDLWYEITPLADGAVMVDTEGSSFDTRLAVYEGSCGSLVEVDCDDDGGTGTLSLINFTGVGGTTYYVRVAGFSANSGVGQVTATYVDMLPNDDCSGAIPVGLGSTLFSNIGGTDSGLNMSCAVGSSVGSTNDVWFSYTATSDCFLIVDTLGSDFDTTIAAYTGDCMALVEVACDDDFFGSPDFLSQMTFAVTAGETYYIQAGSWNTDFGNGSLNIAVDASAGIADSVCAGVPNSTGEGGVLRADGSLVAADNDLTLTAACLPANQNALLVNSSTTATVVNNPGGSAGNLCIASFEMGRHSIMNSGAGGSAVWALDVNVLPTNSGVQPAMIGDTWYFQVWHRDSDGMGGQTSNFTSALSVTFQ